MASLKLNLIQCFQQRLNQQLLLRFTRHQLLHLMVGQLWNNTGDSLQNSFIGLSKDGQEQLCVKTKICPN